LDASETGSNPRIREEHRAGNPQKKKYIARQGTRGKEDKNKKFTRAKAGR